MFTIKIDRSNIEITDGKTTVTIAYDSDLTLEDLINIFYDTVKYVEE